MNVAHSYGTPSYPESVHKADILIVDDQINNLRLLSTMLSAQGYEVRKAVSGRLALNAAEMEPPDIILLDINMPEMNGYEVCSLLKASQRTQEIPVIFLSAFGEALDKVKAFEVGGADYITKPFQLEEVIIRVENQLTLQRQRRQLAEQNAQLKQEICDRERALRQREEAEQALAKSRDFYLTLFEAFPTLIWQAGLDAKFNYFNQSWLNFTGRSLEQEVGDGWVEGIYPNDRERCIRTYLDAFKARQPFEREYRLCRYDGQYRWVIDFGRPFLDLNGNFAGYLGSCYDITDRKRAELKLRLAKKKSEGLLLNILPRSIAEKLREDQSAFAQQFDDATILFADIVGFTPLAAQMLPTKLVSLLNEIFCSFDQLAEKHDLEKIKTIGDAYMVAGGLPTPRPDHAEAIAEMALDMQQKIQQFEREDGTPFQLRIGINTGAVVAGVIGIKRFGYDLWGDAVNVASRMESQGEPGKIQVTTDTYKRLKNKYVFEERGPLFVKGRGKMTTYWLVGRQNKEN
jgi:PAS domain S-box-containing protein